MNDQQRAAMTMALEALDYFAENGYDCEYAIDSLREALAQPVVKESLTAQTQCEDDLTIAYMVGYEKGKDETKEKAAKLCEKEMQAWINFDEDCHEASAIKKCAAAIRGMK